MRCVSLCWALNQGARCGWSLSANYISLVIIVCKLDLQSLTLCNCFINKIVQLYITSEIERRARQWTPRWADKKKEERVSIQSWSEGKNLSWSSSRWFMRGEYAWFVLGSKNLPSRFKSDLNAVQDFFFFFFLTRAPNAPARRSSVKHHFKAHQRVHSDYSDVFATLRHHTASVTTSKWRQQVPLAWTLGCHRNQKEKGKKNKKKPSVQKRSQPIIHTELNIRAVLYEDDLSNTRKKSGSSSECLFRIRGVFLTVASAGGCCQTPVHPKMHLCGASNVWRFFLLLLLRECVGRCFMGLLSFPRLFVGVIMNRGGL